MKQQHCSIKTLKRIAALFAACCVCTETLSGVSDCKPAGVKAGNDKALMIDQTRTLSYVGDRSYTMTLDASAYLSKEFFPENMRYSADGYFEAPYDGKYLVQLWGGDGGDGASAGFTTELKQQTSFPYLWYPVYSPIPGGTGGKGVNCPLL